MKSPFSRPLLALLFSVSVAFAGEELITDGTFQNLESWRLDRLEGAKGSLEAEDLGNGKFAAAIRVPEAADKRYFIQLVQKGIPLDASKRYVLKFRGRSVPGSSIVVKLLEDGGTYRDLWAEDDIALSEEWNDIQLEFSPKESFDSAVFVISGLAQQPGEYWFSDVSLTAVD